MWYLSLCILLYITQYIYVFFSLWLPCGEGMVDTQKLKSSKLNHEINFKRKAIREDKWYKGAKTMVRNELTK